MALDSPDKDNRSVEQLDRRVGVVEQRIWEHEGRISSLESYRDNDRARHSSTPVWVFSSISAFVGVATLLFSLYLAGVRP